MQLRNRIAAVALAGASCVGCGGTASPPSGDVAPPAAGSVWFEEEARERGLTFAHRSGHDGSFLYPEIICGGGALFDMDGDGDLDAYLVQSDGVLTERQRRAGNELFENDGDGRFTDVSAGSGSDDRGYGMGVATGDYDDDGDVDLYVTNLGQNALLRNDGGGQFTDVTLAAGAGEELWSTSAAFFDYDRDGDLDLWIVNYIFWSPEMERGCYVNSLGATYCGPKAYNNPAPDTLLRNEGDGTFTNVSVEAGLRGALGNGLGVGISDVDGDGYLDVFVANDGTRDQLWINEDGRSFRERAVAFGCAADQDGRIKAGMGVALHDLDEDGREDLLVVNLKDEYDSFFLNKGTHFLDRTASIGLNVASQAYTRFGVGFQDFDNDGWSDLFEATGGVSHEPEGDPQAPFAQLNLVYRGREDQRFEFLRPPGATARPLSAAARGAAFGDVDGDGAIDILVVNKDLGAHLLMNRAGAGGNWIQFRVVEGGRDALDAVVTAHVGERRLLRRVRSSASYCAASDPRVHFGLGEHEGVDEVQVLWSDGSVQAFGERAAGSTWELVRGE